MNKKSKIKRVERSQGSAMTNKEKIEEKCRLTRTENDNLNLSMQFDNLMPVFQKGYTQCWS